MFRFWDLSEFRSAEEPLQGFPRAPGPENSDYLATMAWLRQQALMEEEINLEHTEEESPGSLIGSDTHERCAEEESPGSWIGPNEDDGEESEATKSAECDDS